MSDVSGHESKKSENKEWDFHKVEFSALRAEIEFRHKEVARLEMIGPSAIALIYYTLLKYNSDFRSYSVALLWIPVFITWYISVKQHHHMSFASKVMNSYIRRIEDIYAHKDIGGWEHYMAEHRLKGEDRRSLELPRRLLWGMIWCVTLAVAINASITALFGVSLLPTMLKRL